MATSFLDKPYMSSGVHSSAAPEVKAPLKLSDGTEIFEEMESFSAKSHLDIATSMPHKKSTMRHKNAKIDMSDLISESVDPHSAFQVYAGATLQPTDAVISAKLKHSYAKTLNQRQYFAHCQSDHESPYERYARLKQELDRFSRDLKKEFSADPNTKLVLTSITRLGRKLETLRSDTQYSAIFRAKQSIVSLSTMALLKTVEDINRFGSDRLDALSNRDDAAAQLQSGKAKGEKWDLVLPSKPTKMIGSFDRQFVELEKRISRVETDIGYISDMRNPFPDILNAIEFLEARLQYLKLYRFDDIKRRSAEMTPNLKAISYTLYTIQVRFNPKDRQHQKNWERLEDLWLLMSKWDRSVLALPTVVSRLRSLQHIHCRTATLCNRVSQLYDSQNTIIESLQSDSLILQKAVESMKENTKQLETNLLHLKHRLNVLDAKVK